MADLAPVAHFNQAAVGTCRKSFSRTDLDIALTNALAQEAAGDAGIASATRAPASAASSSLELEGSVSATTSHSDGSDTDRVIAVQ